MATRYCWLSNENPVRQSHKDTGSGYPRIATAMREQVSRRMSNDVQLHSIEPNRSISKSREVTSLFLSFSRSDENPMFTGTIMPCSFTHKRINLFIFIHVFLFLAIHDRRSMLDTHQCEREWAWMGTISRQIGLSNNYLLIIYRLPTKPFHSVCARSGSGITLLISKSSRNPFDKSE